MPAINVAKTDTFEVQRQRINQIGTVLFGITQGGSDLSTGILRLGTGSKASPSLAFIENDRLGFYKSADFVSFVSDGKDVLSIGSSGTYSFKDLYAQRRFIETADVSIASSGSGYDVGSYSNISLIGGSGIGSTANLTVLEYNGSVTNSGTNYTPGSFENIRLSGGSGSGALADFQVDDIIGSIISAGSGYTPGIYYNVPFITSGSGSNVAATVTISGSITFTGSNNNPGGYTEGEYVDVNFYNNSPTQTFTVTAVSSGIGSPENYLAINGVSQTTLNLLKGNTYRFDVSSATLASVPLLFVDDEGNELASPFYDVIQVGTPGTSGAFIDFIIKPWALTEQVFYNSTGANVGAGGIINVSEGAVGQYGSGSLASVVIDATGSVSSVTFTNFGSNYKNGDTIFARSSILGGTSNLVYTISSVTNNGSVSSVVFTNQGSNYQLADSLTLNSSNVGGSGSGFNYLITSNPGIIRNFTFSSRGTGYQSGNVLSLFQTTSSSATFTISNNDITVTSSTGIIAGMIVSGSSSIPTGTTVSVVAGNTITLSSAPTASGSATLTFSPTYGNGNGNFAYTIQNTGAVSSVTITSGGSGYAISDELSVSPSDLIQPTTYTVTNRNVSIVTFASTTIPTSSISVGGYLSNLYGQIESTTITASTTIAGQADQVYNGISATTSGIGTGATFNVTRDSNGDVSLVELDAVGNFYLSTDTVTIPGNLVGGTAPTDNIVLSIDASAPILSEVYKVVDNGSGNIQSLYVQTLPYITSSTSVIFYNNTSTQYTISTTSETNRYFINSGSGIQITPSLTLFAGNNYIFDYSDASNTGRTFSLSTFPDGIWSPSLVSNLTGVVTSTTTTLVVADTTGIVPGMAVTKISGSGTLAVNTTVVSVDSSTEITLSSVPTTGGDIILTFTGTEFLDGVTRSSTSILLKVSDSTPNLYYYDATTENQGGEDTAEALLTVNTNNPKTFGSGLSILVNAIKTSDLLKVDINAATSTIPTLLSTSITSVNSTISDTLSALKIIATESVTTPSILNSNLLTITSPSIKTVGTTFEIGDTIDITNSTGNITTIGNISSRSLLINDILSISNENISTVSNNDIIINPFVNRVVKITSPTALIIPSGTTAERPPSLAESGAIRFNEDSGQYEGYSSITSSWSSLGGVRDLDGNTYITAEETIGSNDNTLWFYNDNINTVRFNTEYQEFVNAKKIRSINLSAPDYIDWRANTPVTAGQYVKYFSNIFEVISSGTTASSSSPPSDLSGDVFTNGSATLAYSTTSAAPLTFEEITEIRIAPTGGTSLTVNGKLRFSENVISTIIDDLILRPNSGQKITVDARSSLVIPSGSTGERGNPLTGSIRYNTTITQFEGYTGTNWSSLGGLRDIDGNTFIIPELNPGDNDNTLYFFNNNSNTLRVTETAVEFDVVDTIKSLGSNTLNVDAALITFNNLSASIDTTNPDSTFISTTKDFLDIGLSQGLNNDPLLRFENTGNIYYNIGFGTGTFDGVKVFDSQLKELEIADFKISTNKVTLTKGLINNGSFEIYNPVFEDSAKVQVTAHNITTGEKEFVEYSVINNGSNIFFTDFGNIQSGQNLFDATFDFNVGGLVRINYVVANEVLNNDIIEITTISNITKR